MAQAGAAVIGTGFMGRTHVEALRRAGVRLAGILGSRPEKSKRAAADWSVPRGYANFEEVLSDPEATALHIATPNRFHFEMASAALERGKHVVCEKPLALDTEQSARLVEIARTRPEQAAAVNYNVRYYPLCIEARERIRRGELGRIFHVAGSYVQDWLLRRDDYNWRVLATEGGALRAVADIGTHWLDLVQWVTALEIESLSADLATVHPKRRRPRGEVETFAGTRRDALETEECEVTTEDYGAVLLRFRSGERGALWVSQVTAGRKNRLRFEIAGSERSLAWESERPNELWIGERDEPNRVLIRDPALLSPRAARFAAMPGGHNEGYADSFKQCFRDIYAWIETEPAARGEPEFPTFADGHRELVLCEAVLASAERGERIVIEPRLAAGHERRGTAKDAPKRGEES